MSVIILSPELVTVFTNGVLKHSRLAQCAEGTFFGAKERQTSSFCSSTTVGTVPGIF